MGFRINTNIAAMNAHTSATMNNRNLDNSLAKLSSGLRINTAADDASGLSIANSLRAQASSLGQAVANGNDAIGLIQTADGALSEYSNILNTIKTKTVQAASDTQNTSSRLAIQKDIDALMEELDIIATTTSFNGQKLLSGTFSNKEFQMGANANESVKVNIASATTNSIGQTSRADLNLASDMGGEVSLTMTSATTGKSVTLQTIDVQYNNDRDNSMGALADQINRYSGETGITAKAVVEATATNAVAAGSTGSDFAINGVNIGSVQVADNDNDNTLLNAINSKTSQTGVTATMSSDGKLTLASDGRAIKVEGDVSSVMGSTAAEMSTIGKLELVQQGSAEFQISGIGAGATGGDFTISAALVTTKDSILAAGSSVASGTKLIAGSTVGGDAKLVASMATTQLDTTVKAGSTIEAGSTLAKGTQIGGSMIVGGDVAVNTALTGDMLLTAGSTIEGGSVLGKGTVVSTQFTDNSVTYNVGDVLSNNLTLQAGTTITLTANMTLKDNGSDANSEIATGSTLNTGSILGANMTVGLQRDDDDTAAATVFAIDTASTVGDVINDEGAVTQASGAGNDIDFKAGSVLKAGSIIALNTDGGSYAGPTLVTTAGTLRDGDTSLPGGATFAADTLVTLAEDAYITEDFTSGENVGVQSIAQNSILKLGTTFNTAAAGGSTLDVINSAADMIVADDMVVKAGSTLLAGTHLLAGSSLGHNSYVGGTANTDSAAMTTYQSMTVKAGSTLENTSILAEGSTVGGSATVAKTTLASDMSLKAGTKLEFVTGVNNTMFKAGTIFNQDITLNTANDGTAGSQVSIKAGDVLTQDLYLDDAQDPITLAEDMMMLKDSVIAAGSILAVNTENAGTVGLSNEEFTNLSDIDVTTLEGAMKAIDTVSAAISNLDSIRSELGSVQNQVVSTINNISVTQVNVKAAESNIRDVDFAAESANFSKFNILAQSGSYAMSQANAVQQNVMRLLQ
jgi:flagellin